MDQAARYPMFDILQSPNLSSLGYFLWKYLKDRVSASNLQTVDALNNNTGTEIRRIHHEMLDRVVTNFNVRVAAVIQRQAAWMEDIISY